MNGEDASIASTALQFSKYQTRSPTGASTAENRSADAQTPLFCASNHHTMWRPPTRTYARIDKQREDLPVGMKIAISWIHGHRW